MADGGGPRHAGGGPSPEWSEHLAEIAAGKRGDAAGGRPAEQSRNKPTVVSRVLTLAVIVLLILVVRDVRAIRDPVSIDEVSEAVYLVQEMRLAVDDVNDFVTEVGRFPDAQEAVEFLPEDVQLVRMASGFELSRTVPVLGDVRYSSTEDPDAWLQGQEAALSGGGS